TADRRPGEARRHTGDVRAFRDLGQAVILGLAQELPHIIRLDVGRLNRPLGDAGNDLAAHRADLPLQVPHAGLTRVVADDGADGVVAEGDLLGPQAILANLPRDEILLRNAHLFVISVA